MSILSLAQRLFSASLLFVLIAPAMPGEPQRAGQPNRAKPVDPKRVTWAEAMRLLAGEAEGNLAKRPNSFTRTRLASGQVLELYYPVAVPKRGSQSLKGAGAGYGLLYESEASYREATRPRHILEDLIPDGEAFVGAVPQLVARLEKRVGVGAGALNYSRASLKRIDAYVAGYQRTRTTAETDPRLFQELTAYYGEALRRALGGEWRVRREQVDRARAQAEPNVAFGAAEIKPWDGVISAYFNEDRRGLGLAAVFAADLQAARGSR